MLTQIVNDTFYNKGYKTAFTPTFEPVKIKFQPSKCKKTQISLDCCLFHYKLQQNKCVAS